MRQGRWIAAGVFVAGLLATLGAALSWRRAGGSLPQAAPELHAPGQPDGAGADHRSPSGDAGGAQAPVGTPASDERSTARSNVSRLADPDLCVPARAREFLAAVVRVDAALVTAAEPPPRLLQLLDGSLPPITRAFLEALLAKHYPGAALDRIGSTNTQPDSVFSVLRMLTVPPRDRRRGCGFGFWSLFLLDPGFEGTFPDHATSLRRSRAGQDWDAQDYFTGKPYTLDLPECTSAAAGLAEKVTDSQAALAGQAIYLLSPNAANVPALWERIASERGRHSTIRAAAVAGLLEHRAKESGRVLQSVLRSEPAGEMRTFLLGQLAGWDEIVQADPRWWTAVLTETASTTPSDLAPLLKEQLPTTTVVAIAPWLLSTFGAAAQDQLSDACLAGLVRIADAGAMPRELWRQVGQLEGPPRRQQALKRSLQPFAPHGTFK